MSKAAKKEITPISNSGLKEFCKRYLALNEEKQEATDAIKDLMQEVKGAGVDPKQFKAACKALEKPPEDDYKEGVNFIIEANGQQRLFA